MSKKERLALSLDKITDLVFTISELVIDDSSEGEAAIPSTSGTSALSAEAPSFIPTSGEGGTSANQGSITTAISEDWESIPDLPSASVDTPPTFSQVVGGSQSVYVTPIRRLISVESTDSVNSLVDMAQPAAGAVPVVQPAPDYANITAAQFEAYWNALPNDAARQGAETVAMINGNDPSEDRVLDAS